MYVHMYVLVARKSRRWSLGLFPAAFAEYEDLGRDLDKIQKAKRDGGGQIRAQQVYYYLLLLFFFLSLSV